MKTVFAAVVCVVPLIAFACGGGEKPPENPPTPSATESTTASAPASASAAASASASTAPSASAVVAWKDMNKEQRIAHMKTKVLPKMTEDFSGWDAKKYGKEFGCKTCHGDGAKEGGNFKMPNPKLPKLPTDPAGFKALMDKKPDAMKFMGGKVKPDMAGLLGMEQFEPGKNESGFGCYNCHEKAAAAPLKKDEKK